MVCPRQIFGGQINRYGLRARARQYQARREPNAFDTGLRLQVCDLSEFGNDCTDYETHRLQLAWPLCGLVGMGGGGVTQT